MVKSVYEALGLSRLFNAAIDLLYPPIQTCPLCGTTPASHSGTCAKCWMLVRTSLTAVCKRCGRPGDLRMGLCVECARGEHSFSSVRAVGLYGGALRRLILQMKFYGRFDLANTFGKMIAYAAGYDHDGIMGQFPSCGGEASPPLSDLPLGEMGNQGGQYRSGDVPGSSAHHTDQSLRDIDGLTWVPMHPIREKQRGYNQAKIIARRVSYELGIPLLGEVLARTVNSAPQTTLGGAERRENLKGSVYTRVPRLAKGKKILLIDDVMTTGATLDVCSEALYWAGAREVHALVVATSRVIEKHS